MFQRKRRRFNRLRKLPAKRSNQVTQIFNEYNEKVEGNANQLNLDHHEAVLSLKSPTIPWGVSLLKGEENKQTK